MNPNGYAHVLETWNGGSEPAETFTIALNVIGQNISGAPSYASTYFMFDGEGSTRQLTAYTPSASTTNGHVVGRDDYDAFGNPIKFTASTHAASYVTAPIGFKGTFLDPATGNVIEGRREYDPELDRFWTKDSGNFKPGDWDNANLYVAFGGSPLDLSDPNGHGFDTIVSIGLAAMIVGLVGYGGLSLFVAYNSQPVAIHAIGLGGPDVTRDLLAIDSYVTAKGNAGLLPPLSLGWDSWDIKDFAGWGRPEWQVPGGRGVVFDGTNYIKTVTVAGKVYRPEEVNYYLYGVWLRSLGVSELLGETKVAGHRSVNAGGTGVPGRIAWFRAGYSGDLSEAETAAIQGATPAFPGGFSQPLYFHLDGGSAADKSIRGTVIGAGAFVVPEDVEPPSIPDLE